MNENHDRGTSGPSVHRLYSDLWYLMCEHLEDRDISKVARLDRHLHQLVNALLYRRNVKQGWANSIPWAVENGHTKVLNFIEKMFPTESIFQLASEGAQKKELEQGSYSDRFEWPLLHSAAIIGNTATTQWLLDRGADINASSKHFCRRWSNDPYGGCDEHFAKQPDTSCMAQHHRERWPIPLAVDLDQTRSVSPWWDWTEQPHWRALYMAICHRQSEVASLLIKSGALLQLDANPNEAMNTGYTALHLAAYYHQSELIKDIKSVTNLSNHSHEEHDFCLQTEDCASRNQDQHDSCGNTALHYALYTIRPSTSLRSLMPGCDPYPCGVWSTIHELSTISDVNSRNIAGYSPLDLMVVTGQAHMIMPLVACFRFDINRIRDQRGVTLLQQWVQDMFTDQDREPWAFKVNMKPILLTNWSMPVMPVELINIGARLDLEDFSISTGNLWRNHTPLVWALRFASKGIDGILKCFMRAADEKSLSLATLNRTITAICAECPKPTMLRPLLEYYRRYYQRLTAARANRLVDLVLTSTQQAKEIVNIDKLATVTTILEFSESLGDGLTAPLLSVLRREQSLKRLGQTKSTETWNSEENDDDEAQVRSIRQRQTRHKVAL